jgi:hypothetical protein
MKEKIIKTQKQLDAIKKDFEGVIFIEGGTIDEPLILSTRFECADVIVRGEAVISMWGNSVVRSMWENSVVQSMWGNSVVQSMRGNSVVQDMWENSVVQDMWGNSVVRSMWENSVVQSMWGNSVVQSMRGNSVVQDMWENSVVQDMWENSVVQDMWGNSVVRDLYGEAMVTANGLNSITCHGYNIVRTSSDNQKNLILVINPESHLIVIPKFEATFEDFARRYPVKVHDGKAIFYKAVHLRNGHYYSNHDDSFEYKIGETVKHVTGPKSEGSCAPGLHIAHKQWAIAFGKNWSDMALLECEIPVETIVVAEDCDGKVRCGELKVIREVPQNEW